jgi:hypothetical protein
MSHSSRKMHLNAAEQKYSVYPFKHKTQTAVFKDPVRTAL